MIKGKILKLSPHLLIWSRIKLKFKDADSNHTHNNLLKSIKIIQILGFPSTDQIGYFALSSSVKLASHIKVPSNVQDQLSGELG